MAGATQSNHELFYIFIGMAISLIVQFAGAFIANRFKRSDRMEEVIAERRVNANQQAYRHTKNIQGLLIQKKLEDVRKGLDDNQDWFFNNALYLPENFKSRWCSIRSVSAELSIYENNLPTTKDSVIGGYNQLTRLINEAFSAIYVDMGLKRVNVERLVKDNEKRVIKDIY